MYALRTIGCVVFLLSIASGTVIASIQGPTYPAPGGNDYSAVGSGLTGTQTRTYSNFDTGAFAQLYLGLDQVDYGVNGAGLNNTANPFSLYSVSGTTAEWRASTVWLNPSTHVLTNLVPTRLVMTVGGLGSNPWVTDLASIGLDDVGMFGVLGAVIDNSLGLDFTLSWKIEANTGSGWQSISSVQQDPSHSGYTKSNFATGFYYVEPAPNAAVPEPLSVLVWGSLILGFIAAHRINERYR